MKISTLLTVLSLLLLSCDKSGVKNNPNAQNIAGYGDITGKVVNAATGNPINGATVYMVGAQGTTSTTSNASGDYTITDAPAGSRVVQGEMATYNSATATAEVPVDATVSDVNLALLPVAFATGKITIILTWGADPTDLDSYLHVPNGLPYYVVSYMQLGNIGADPFALLDLDDTSSFGPETTTIDNTGVNPHFPGTYRFVVNNFSTGGMAISDAVVKVYNEGILVKTYNVANAAGTLTGDFWHVFDLTGTTFTDVNTVLVADPGSPP